VEHLIVELVATLLDILGEFVLQMLFELTANALSGLIKPWKKSSSTASLIGVALAGLAAGFLSAFLFPRRLIGTRVVVPGLSLLLAPLCAGCAMYFLGKRMRRFGPYPSNLATFSGGAIFAFSMALVRWWLVGLPR